MSEALYRISRKKWALGVGKGRPSLRQQDWSRALGMMDTICTLRKSQLQRSLEGESMRKIQKVVHGNL